MKPSGKCSTCKYVHKCCVDSQSMAKLVQCVYREDFEKDDKKVAHKKTKRT